MEFSENPRLKKPFKKHFLNKVSSLVKPLNLWLVAWKEMSKEYFTLYTKVILWYAYNGGVPRLEVFL